MTAPRRRWPRFTLPTLFVVVTVVCVPLGWIAYQINWIRERQAVLRVAVENQSDGFPNRADAPWQVRVLGLPAVRRIWVGGGLSIDEAHCLGHLFPEAALEWYPGDGTRVVKVEIEYYFPEFGGL